ncbi:hypothetical protein ASPWEDRAFT_164298 [Aspergillus wentii DTO 134E9]|uniref:Helicase ATP-binding domain-containing protein n=1 Tax=Aspergillus wentii DTO 134E9 TaxID=1073089 RepID=A0A1L9R5U1_ASPWE|nr:uncharacterized protein ASPWEDRAFT_164298 [Aspergillus wentii DTO 134E9]KAI9925224.1 hypothetical protein MW887_006144 [Aspergillus wentii]OJJ30285.1 hypothetical protein ASPWEDRAFT_164298 [Aspergillus wentii DTO 134E9]
MAKESDAPPFPHTPGKPQEHPSRPLPQHPEFGKPSPIRPSHHHQQSSNPFNIPKANRPRVEHHRPNPQQWGAQNHAQKAVARQGYGPPATPRAGVAATPKRSEPFDPFKPVRPSAYNNNRMSRPVDNDVVEIKRPENFTFNTPRAPKTFFTSKPSAIKMNNMNNANKNLRNFVDLTNEGGFSPSVRPNNTGFGSMDVNGYVDTAKANENIKALLEGAFEDEDDKPRPKPKSKKNKKKKEKKSKQKKEEMKTEEKKVERKEESSEVDDLAAALQGVSVNETKKTEDKVDESEKDSDSDSEKEVKGKEQVAESESEAEDEDADEQEDDDEDEEDEDDGTIEGLKVKLLPHQREGVNWMCDKELGQKKSKGVLPKGGILADDMGLGKTVQAIALLLTNRKPTKEEHSKRTIKSDDDSEDDEKNDKKATKLPPGVSKSTLVIAPLALIKQWESEIAEKVENSHKLRVCVYHGNTRAKANDNLEDYDVVITTYGTLTSEHGAMNKKSGIFSVYWYRVILDEAHTIKNRNAKATQSAYALDAEYRWCLTGTPLQNNLDELQSLIKFLRIKPFNDLAAWKEQISKPLANGRGGLAIERLHIYLKIFMKRRTKDVLKLNANLKPGEEGGDGKKKKNPGFQIVKREVVKVEAEFMPGEMTFYQRLEQRTENSLDKMMGGTKLDYAGALVLLLRLRQSCNHPDLVKSDLAQDKDVLLQTGPTGSQQPAKKDDLDSMADLFGALSVVSKKCDVCQTDLSQDQAKNGISRCSACETDLAGSLANDWKRSKKSSHKKDEDSPPPSPSDRRSKAQIARSQRNRKIVIDSDDEEEEDGEWIVPEHKRNMPNLGKAGGSDDENAEGGGEWLNSEDETDSEDDGPESPTQKRKSAVHINRRGEETDSEDEIYLNPDDDDNQVLPSTKIRHLMKILSRESAGHKFIVFSVFTSMLDKIEPFLMRANIGFARYDGGMRNDHREASLNKLRNNSATRVLLCSLRAGALGLNLTAASRVVILEPFWNPFVEEQAIDRVHRLNQTQDVKIYKMIIKETVEERIIDLQERKRELANLTIEGKSAAGKLTMTDMMALFGRDAESRYTGNQEAVDVAQMTKLLTKDDAMKGSMPDSSRDRSRQQEKRAPRSEDSVYGRRW